MKVGSLSPSPLHKELFQRRSLRFVPESPGCYVLATFEEDILYLGLANHLRRRLAQHLDTPEKTKPTQQGRAFWFFWFECEELHQVERTWMNMHVLEHGTLPILNKLYSPTSV